MCGQVSHPKLVIILGIAILDEEGVENLWDVESVGLDRGLVDAHEDLYAGSLVLNDSVQESQCVVLKGSVGLGDVHDLEEHSN